MRGLIGALTGICLLVIVAAQTAFADGGITTDGYGVEAKDVARHNIAKRRASVAKRHKTDTPRRADSSREKGVASKKADRAAAPDPAQIRQRQIQAEVAAYETQVATREVCLASEHSERCPGASRPQFGNEPLDVVYLDGNRTEPTSADRVTLSPQEVAYIAFARLNLTPVKPGIGPPPKLNRWKMAAVGYPLWLWGEGATDPAPVSDSVGGLYVSLDAHISKMVFDMGDGTSVTCQGTGQKWGKWVDAGAQSPSCGHTYTVPSLPKRKYTVTATTYWSVAWNVTGQTGVIPFVQSSSTSLPVGELQTLVR